MRMRLLRQDAGPARARSPWLRPSAGSPADSRCVVLNDKTGAIEAVHLRRPAMDHLPGKNSSNIFRQTSAWMRDAETGEYVEPTRSVTIKGRR